MLNREGHAAPSSYIKNVPTKGVWGVYETGSPYRHNGAIRNGIARAAIGLIRVPLFGRDWGTCFVAVYRAA